MLFFFKLRIFFLRIIDFEGESTLSINDNKIKTKIF